MKFLSVIILPSRKPVAVYTPIHSTWGFPFIGDDNDEIIMAVIANIIECFLCIGQFPGWLHGLSHLILEGLWSRYCYSHFTDKETKFREVTYPVTELLCIPDTYQNILEGQFPKSPPYPFLSPKTFFTFSLKPFKHLHLFKGSSSPDSSFHSSLSWSQTLSNRWSAPQSLFTFSFPLVFQKGRK